MKIVSTLRLQGHGLSVAEIFQNMRLGDAARVLRMDGVPIQEKMEAYRSFSTLRVEDLDLFLTRTVRPKLADPTWAVNDVCPVTDTQALDIRGTIHVPRTSVQYTVLYFNSTIDRQRLLQAASELVQAHEILRTVFIEDGNGSYFQVVLEFFLPNIEHHKADGDLEKSVKDLCNQDIESKFPLGGQFLKFFIVEGADDSASLVIRLSHAQYDGVSLPRLLQDLQDLYMKAPLHGFESYPAYIAHTRNPRVKEKAQKYWRNLLKGSSLSRISLDSPFSSGRSIVHLRPVSISSNQYTVSTVLTAAWALLLARRLCTQDVTFGNITSGRNIDMPNVGNVVGPCYNFTPVRVSFEPDWTTQHLLGFVQKQIGESSAHDFVGFGDIANDCTAWRDEGADSFDSVVHHHPDDADIESIPFAGEECKVDVHNPHGDAVRPIKALTFVKGGTVYAGVVGSEGNMGLVNALLDELVENIDVLGRGGVLQLEV